MSQGLTRLILRVGTREEVSLERALVAAWCRRDDNNARGWSKLYIHAEC